MKTKDIAIIAIVGFAAYMWMKKRQQINKVTTQPGYNIYVPEPDKISEDEFNRMQMQDQRRIDNIKNAIATGSKLLTNLFGKKEADKKSGLFSRKKKKGEIGQFF